MNSFRRVAVQSLMRSSCHRRVVVPRMGSVAPVTPCKVNWKRAASNLPQVLSQQGSLSLGVENNVTVIGVFEECVGENQTSHVLQKLFQETSFDLKSICGKYDFSGKVDTSVDVILPNKGRVLLVGMGKESACEPRIASSIAMTTARLIKPTWDSIAFGFARTEPLARESLVSFLSFFIAHTRPDDRFKSSTFKSNRNINISLIGMDQLDEMNALVTHVLNLAHGIRDTMEIVNAPPNYATPTHLADFAATLVRNSPDRMALKVLEEEHCSKYGKHGMGLFLGVAKGSVEPPKFIHLTYKSGEARKKIALVGKGITFDSGGINLKVGEGSMIEHMKMDLGGAAAVLGAASAISRIQPDNVEVHFIVPSCENMIGGNATRPGDVLTASDGTTVEIKNTDAEGRLALADALLYAQDLGCTEIVDVATLTGACIVALGDQVAGLMASDDAFATRVLAAAKSSGEYAWHLPLPESYKKLLETPCADIQNVGPRAGGALTAGLFLQHFVKSDKAWAHLDIAGPVYSMKNSRASGFGTSTLVKLVLDQ